MSCSLVTGLPRHGKSYFGTLQALEELRRSERYVVTNLPLDLKEVGKFCEIADGMPVESRMRGRLRMLTTQETCEFWLYDPEGEIVKGVKLFEPQPREWHRSLKPRSAIMVPDFSRRQDPDYPGVLYIIDEAHLFFDAHHWQEIGDDASYFISQHGHMRTDILFITQHPGKLAKRLKLDLEEWTAVTNLGRVKGWKGVTLPGWFVRETYAGKPDDPKPGEPERGRFRLKPDSIGKLYSTSAGVGLSGRVDTQEKKRGKHWSKWAIYGGVGAVLMLLLPIFGLRALGALVHRGVGGYLEGSTGISKRVSGPDNKLAGALVPSRLPAPAPPAGAALATPPAPPQPLVVGLSKWGVCLDDGRVLRASEGYRWAEVPGGVAISSIGMCKWKVQPPASVPTAGEPGRVQSVL